MKKILLLIALILITGYSYSSTIDEQIKNEEIATYWDMNTSGKGCYLRSLKEPKETRGVMFYQKTRPTLEQIQNAISGDNKTNVIERKKYTVAEINALINAKVTELVAVESLKEITPVVAK